MTTGRHDVTHAAPAAHNADLSDPAGPQPVTLAAHADPARPRPRVPRLIAHRGMSALAPENTLPAFRACLDYGVEWFEFDCDILGDATVVAIHDPTVDRTTDRRGSLSDLTVADLDRIDAGSWFAPQFAGVRIPTLAQVVDLINETGLNANLEIKAVPRTGKNSRLLVDGIASELNRLHPDREVLVSSFNPVLLKAFRRRAPHFPVATVFESRTLAKLWRVNAAHVGASALHPSNRTVTKDHVAAYRATGRHVNVWTVNNVERARELVSWGVTGLITDIAHEFPPTWRGVVGH